MIVRTKIPDYLCHSDNKKSKSKYQGGFKNGKNTSAYNHDYYIHNKEKWLGNAIGTLKNTVSNWFWIKKKKASTSFNKSTVANSLSASKDQFDKDYKKFLRQQRNRSEMPKIGPGSIKIDMLTSGEVKKNDGSKYKYKYRVTLPNGKYRYFYSDVEYYSFMSHVGLKDPNATIEEDCAAVNPHYGEPGYATNCPYATLAYDLRRRGYNVEAIDDEDGAYRSNIKNFYVGGEWTDHKPDIFVRNGQRCVNSQKETPKLFSEFESYGPGARGHLTVRWQGGGGHDMAWEVDKDGKAYIIDAQTNNVFSVDTFIASGRAHNVEWGMVQYMRTDNLQLSPNIVNGGKELDATYDQLFVSSGDDRHDFKYLDESSIVKQRNNSTATKITNDDERSFKK